MPVDQITPAKPTTWYSTDSMHLDLIRFAYTPMGTFGYFILPTTQRPLVTVERPWKNNLANISCFPEGSFACRPKYFHTGGYQAVEITVPQRVDILFHIANRWTDVKGCVGVGRRLGCLSNPDNHNAMEWAILDSRVGFSDFMGVYGEKEFTLTVRRFSPAFDSLPAL